MTLRIDRMGWALACCLVLCLASCGDDDGDSGTDEPGGEIASESTDPGDSGPTGDAEVDEPDSLSVPAFSIHMAPYPTLGVTGQAFSLSAAVGFGEPDGDLTWAWELDGGVAEGAADGATITVAFEMPGEHRVLVTATDGAGNSLQTGALLQVFQPGDTFVLGDVDGDGATSLGDAELALAATQRLAQLDPAHADRADILVDGRLTEQDAALIEAAAQTGKGAPIFMSPTSGARGRVVHLMHPALLSPAARALLVFGDAEPVIPVRGRPGYATTFVPMTLDAAATIEIALLVDGEEVERFDFEVLEPAATSAIPGATVLEAMSLLAQVSGALPGAVTELVDAVEFSGDEAKVLQGLASFTSVELAARAAEFETVFAALDPAIQTLYEELALANGLADAIGELHGLAERLSGAKEGALSVSTTAAIITVVCLIEDIADVSEKLAGINNVVGPILDVLSIGATLLFPPAKPVLAVLSKVSEIVGIVTDVIDLIASFTPKLTGLDVSVTGPDESRPGVLRVGEKATIEVLIEFSIAEQICTGSLGIITGKILDKVKKLFLQRLTSGIPVVGDLFKKPEDQLGAIEAKVVSVVNAAVGKILGWAGVNDLISKVAGQLCSALKKVLELDEPKLPLAPSSAITETSCGAVSGSGATGSWECTDECNPETVTFDAEGPDCADELTGSGRIACRDCTADSCEGCCSKQLECRPGESIQACGTGGGECTECESHEECNEGKCECISDCDEEMAGQGKHCVEGKLRLCKEVAEGCFKESPPVDCLAGQATCEDGECVGGCGPWNCECCVKNKGTQKLECKPKKCETTADVGDPHLITFDGLAYDFQGKGEFVLVEPNGSGPAPVIHARKQPSSATQCTGVSFNTAVATMAGGARVAFYAGASPPLMIDGLPVPLAKGGHVALPGDARVDRLSSQQWDIRWGDGGTLTIKKRGDWMDLYLSLPDVYAGKVRGLMGNYNGLFADDLVLVDGSVINQPAPFGKLYGAFADAYRVTPGTSLFDYSEGETTADFQDPTFPGGPKTSADLEPQQKADAAAVCDEYEFGEPALLQACILDVACTGPIAALGLAGLDAAAALAVAFPVQFTGWTVEGDPSNGKWQPSEDGLSVVQTVNGDPTFFVSPETYIGTTLYGTIRVEDSDDDYIGIAFGYNGPLAANGDAVDAYDMLLLSWKSSDQGGEGGFGPEGYTLARITGAVPKAAFWAHVDFEPDYEVLFSNYGEGLGWKQDVDYQFRLDYTTDRIRILVNGLLVVDVTAADTGVAAFPAGHYAFYNYSQSDVLYSDFFTAELTPAE